MATITLPTIQRKTEAGEKLVMVTAYDFTSARLVESADVDLLLVGDSLGNVVQGLDSTVPVTLDEMVYHTRLVARARTRAFLVSDLPFGAYHEGESAAVRSACRLLKEGGADAVKLEGGGRFVRVVERLVSSGISVMGHLGLTPQTAVQLGGYRVQGRDADSAIHLQEEARRLEDAGAFALVLECVPSEVAAWITDTLEIPTIGIGAGPSCSGQVLVYHDLLGLYHGQKPRFVRAYGDLQGEATRALKQFAADVRIGAFPSRDESYLLSEAEREKLRARIGGERFEKLVGELTR